MPRQLPGGTVTRIDSVNLATVLEAAGQRRRAFRSDSWYRGLRPSGKDALAAYQVLSRGERTLVNAVVGQVDVRILTPAPNGRTRLDLFRKRDVDHRERARAESKYLH